MRKGDPPPLPVEALEICKGAASRALFSFFLKLKIKYIIILIIILFFKTNGNEEG